MAAVTVHSDFGAQENKICILSFFAPIFHEVMGPDIMILVFEHSVLRQIFQFPLFTLIRKVVSSSSLSAIRLVSSAYLRLLIFLPRNLNHSL